MIGREPESEFMLNLLDTPKSEMLAVFGRRRVGKTYLIKTVYKEHLSLYITGVQDCPREEQLFLFFEKLKDAGYQGKRKPKNWNQAFLMLKEFLKAKKKKKKHVLFFDELPWLASGKSGFLSALAYFWNDWASDQNIVIVICGSAASWMIEHVVNNKGGLHNRITKKIHLEPFTLYEVDLFLKSKKIHLEKKQIIELYMVFGGIPYYWDELKKGESAIQTINRVCFEKLGLLKTEFDNLYAALFDFHQNHIELVETLAKKWKGFTRNEIIENSTFTNGGGLTKLLDELRTSSFIEAYLPYGKLKKDTLYRLADEYSLFYLTFIKNNTSNKKDTWLKLAEKPVYNNWKGYAFENICLKHIFQLKSKLGIQGVHSQESSFRFVGNEEIDGFQLDLVLDRADNTINICEMKFLEDDFYLTKEYAQKLRKRREGFRKITKTKKQLFTTLITTYGIKHNEHSLGLIDNVMILDDLFVPNPKF